MLKFRNGILKLGLVDMLINLTNPFSLQGFYPLFVVESRQFIVRVFLQTFTSFLK
jgi:hypothetical protein